MSKALAEKNENYRQRRVKIGVIQLKGSSLKAAEEYIRQAVADRPDVLVLPEIGCGDKPQNLQKSTIVRKMQKYARLGKMYLVVNVNEDREAKTFNTTLIIGRTGKIEGRYRKVHIPLFAEKNDRQAGGKEFPVFDLDFGRVGIEVCFDNYFPESVRSLALQGAEIIFYPHQEHFCWNEVEHIEILSRARAIENVVFMVPCGPTAAEKGPFGRTAIIDPTGKYVMKLPPQKEGYGSVTIDLGLINRVLIDSGPVPMRTQMLADQRKKKLSGRRRPEIYSSINQS